MKQHISRIFKIASNIIDDSIKSFEMTEKEWTRYNQIHPNAKRENHQIVPNRKIERGIGSKIQLTDEQKKLHKMSLSENKDDRISVAQNKNTHPLTLHKLSGDKDNSVRRYAAGNPNVSQKTLNKLSKDENYYVRGGVAKNKKTRPEILDRLSKDGHPDVRSAVAQNPNTPEKILHKLSKDSDMWVKKDLVSNENAPVSVLKNLCNDPDANLELALFTKNEEILEELSKNEDKQIKDIATEKLNNMRKNVE
jgi:hypothetical protein